jgi:uncharacterized protein YbcV (DUF1398 family)
MAHTFKDRKDIVRVVTVKATNVAVLRRFLARAQSRRVMRQAFRAQLAKGGVN